MESKKKTPQKKNERKRDINPALDTAEITFASNKLGEANKIVANLVMPK